MHRSFYPASAAVTVIMVMVIMSIPAEAQDDDKTYKYTGVKRCSMCHRGEQNGRIYEIWEATKHSKAYKTLGTRRAKEVAKKAGVNKDPQKASECLKCHVTGYGAPESKKMSGYDKTNGVWCETCHGPGSVYQRMSIMRDHEKFINNGGKIPVAEDCKGCHNENSPTFIGFEFEKFHKKIEHFVPRDK